MRTQRGLTLIELMIAVAIMAIVASLAVPSLAAQLERRRLKATAEAMADDFAQARFEAARSGQPLHVGLQTGPGWCWAVSTATACPCGVEAACQIKRVQAREHHGVTLVEGTSRTFTPTGSVVTPITGAELASTRGERLRVEMTPLGRAHICSPQASVPGYPRC